MSSPVTDIRLISTGDAEAITQHIRRDREAKARWEPAYPPDYFILDGQRRRIERSWPDEIMWERLLEE